mgnify:CR=1 FL=1
MNDLINKLTLKVNNVCFGDEFKKAFIEKFHYLPSGLTYHIKENAGIEFIPMVKLYGYEHSCNNGLDEYSDLGDFDIGDYNINNEQSDFMYDYFKDNYPDFYNKYMVCSYVY